MLHPNRPVIFKIGSCRTSLDAFFPAGAFHSNYALSHTSKEAIQWMKLLQGNMDMCTITHVDMVVHDKERFDIEKYRRLYQESDVLLVEISSLKTLSLDGSYYNLNFFRKKAAGDPELKKAIRVSIQRTDNLRNDLLEIRRLAGHKRVVFIGHLLMDFYDLPGFNPAHRRLIDSVLREEPGSIILADLFREADDYKDIFDGDPNHLRESSKERIARRIEEAASRAL